MNFLLTLVDGDQVDVEIEYAIFGKHIPATYYEPEEFPEVSINSIVESETGRVIKMEEISASEYSKVEEKIFDNMRDERETDELESEIEMYNDF